MSSVEDRRCIVNKPLVTKQGKYQNKQRMVSVASDNAGLVCKTAINETTVWCATEYIFSASSVFHYE